MASRPPMQRHSLGKWHAAHPSHMAPPQPDMTTWSLAHPLPLHRPQPSKALPEQPVHNPVRCCTNHRAWRHNMLARGRRSRICSTSRCAAASAASLRMWQQHARDKPSAERNDSASMRSSSGSSTRGHAAMSVTAALEKSRHVIPETQPDRTRLNY